MTSLSLALLYLLAAVLGVVVCRMIKVPPMLGYLAVGVFLGPNALALAQNVQSVHYLGEFGVVFLMFVIGLEFNLPKLRAMRQHVLGLGSLQVLLTIAICTFGSLALAKALPHWWKMEWQTALALSSAVAMSSTAVVIKLMAERLELESEHGKRVLGILLFQDLAVVPLLVLIPALGASSESLFWTLALATVKAFLLVGCLLVGGPHVMRWWLNKVARYKSDELFVLNILLTALGLAWLTELAGLSLVLGAFVAGMLISETPYKHQVETDIRPFHDVLLGLFFISIGMMLDWQVIAQRWPLVLLLFIVPMFFKLALITALARWLGASPGMALRTGLYLAQAGEFGFVLLALAQQNSLVAPELLSPILAAMVLSLLITPFVIMHANTLVLKLISSEWLVQSLHMTRIASKAMGASDHVIICGYGRCGQNLAQMLKSQSIAYLALDLDPDRVSQAAAAGDSVVYGDATRIQALTAAGLARASAVVVTFKDTPTALKLLAHIRQQAPQLPVLVRTLDDHDLERLQQAGATEVVPEAIEGSLMLASHVLALVGVPMRRVIRLVQEQRDARYGLLRGYFHGADDDTVDEMDHERLHTVEISPSFVDETCYLGDLQLDAYDVKAIALRRKAGQPVAITANPFLQAGDTLVLSGRPEGLAMALERISRFS